MKSRYQRFIFYWLVKAHAAGLKHPLSKQDYDELGEPDWVYPVYTEFLRRMDAPEEQEQ